MPILFSLLFANACRLTCLNHIESKKLICRLLRLITVVEKIFSKTSYCVSLVWHSLYIIICICKVVTLFKTKELLIFLQYLSLNLEIYCWLCSALCYKNESNLRKSAENIRCDFFFCDIKTTKSSSFCICYLSSLYSILRNE